MECKVKYKFGTIEFEAEGDEALIERERQVFLNKIIPVAIEDIRQANFQNKTFEIIESPTENSNLLACSDIPENNLVENNTIENNTIDLSRESLVSFIKKYGNLSNQDFVLFAIYFNEYKNKIQSFSSDNIKQFYKDARRQEYSNISQLPIELVKKGFIMDDDESSDKKGKKYKLTQSGIYYVENYNKGEQEEKKKTKQKAYKPKNINDSLYASINADDLNMNKYVEIKTLKNFKDQMVLLLYIMTNEGKGDTFSVIDIIYLMTNILGLPATANQISGIIRRNKTWFTSEQDLINKKLYRYKLLQGAKVYAETIVSNGNIQ